MRMPSCEKGSHFSGVSLKNWSFERSTKDAKRIVWISDIRLFLSLFFFPYRSLSFLYGSPRGSSSRDCRIVEGVRPFRRRFSSVKLFRCQRMPSREIHVWLVYLRVGDMCTDQIESKRSYMLYGSCILIQ